MALATEKMTTAAEYYPTADKEGRKDSSSKERNYPGEWPLNVGLWVEAISQIAEHGSNLREEDLAKVEMLYERSMVRFLEAKLTLEDILQSIREASSKKKLMAVTAALLVV